MSQVLIQCFNLSRKLINRNISLQDLSTSLEAVYGQANEGINSEEILKKFYDWKCDKREELTSVRSETEVSLQCLVAWFQSTLQVIRALAQWHKTGNLKENFQM